MKVLNSISIVKQLLTNISPSLIEVFWDSVFKYFPKFGIMIGVSNINYSHNKTIENERNDLLVV